jgi:nitric oxide reductase large subunit
MVLGFTGLITITTLAYRNAPPIPVQVVDGQGIALYKTIHNPISHKTQHIKYKKQ